MDNIILQTDSYKLTHWKQYQPDTEVVYSYFESRQGAEFPFTVAFGMQAKIEEYLYGPRVTRGGIEFAEKFVEKHLGSRDLFNREMWEYILSEYGGHLPLKIKAVPEGTIVPVGNVIMTVENTDPKCFPLTNYVETLLTHVWYPSTVATLSKFAKNNFLEYLERTGDPANIDFMLHDFGYRGVSSEESAQMGGMGHLINFKGTDTVTAMIAVSRYYGADFDTLAFSVPATEHSVMTSLGREGEIQILDQLLENFPTGILSVVADSYDIYNFTQEVVKRKDVILARDGRFVLRPDSITKSHSSPAELTLDLVRSLWLGFGGTKNDKGFHVLDDHIRVLWGDGIDIYGCLEILNALEAAGFSADNMVFGMGGGLLQKINRDTQRFAFKCSAQKRNGKWYDISKNPLDASKASKAGRLKLINTNGGLKTVREDEVGEDLLQVIFENGEMKNLTTFDEIRERANG
jgi:nicotinamide phosphoribosyltransferase